MDRARRHEQPAVRGHLARRLLVAMLVPAALALLAFGFFAHEVARRALEDELGRRLAATASGVAAQILPEQVQALAAGDENSRTYANILARLEEARQRFDVRRLIVLAADGTGRGDTEGRIGLGAEAHELAADRDELYQALSGRAVSSPLFSGRDGKPVKRGYAPIGAHSGVVVAEGAADFYTPLSRFRRWLLLWASLALLALTGFTVVLAQRITGPVGRLAAAAERIGAGDLERPILVESRDEIGVLARTLDEMRSALRSRDERMQMMLTGIAHEVRNPLGGLELFAGLLREGLLTEPQAIEDRCAEVKRIEREIAYLKAVVSEFLDYARRPALEKTSVDVLALVTACVELCQDDRSLVKQVDATGKMASQSCAIVVENQLPAGFMVQGDSVQLRRAVLNLLKNAVAAAGPGGRVVVQLVHQAERGRQGFVLEVRDSGPGIDDAIRDKLFVPFFTTREKGTGLGLAFVHDIVRDHGGRVEVDRAPEGGACFRLVL